MQILIDYLKKYWKMCLLVLFLASVNQVFSLLDPYVFRLIVDNYATKFGEYTFSEFTLGVSKLLLLTIGIAFVSRIAKNFQDFYLNSITKRLGAQLYADGVKHSLALPYRVFEDQRSGETLNLLQKSRTDTENFITNVINIVFVSLIGFIFVTIYAINLYWGIAVAYALTAPIIGFVIYFLSNKIKSIQERIVKETVALAGSTTESLRNIELVKSLGLSDQEVGRLNNTTQKILDLELQKLKYIRSISFIQGTIINFLRTCIQLFMFVLIFKGIITVGEFFSLLIYSYFIFEPLQMLGSVMNSFRETQVSLKRYKEIIDKPVEPIPVDSKHLNNLNEIEFNEVSFSYSDNVSSAVNNISFNIKRGDTVAFVGPSGSGKTSVIKLIVGLYNPFSGSVLYNGIKSTEINLNDLRSQIGFVTQDTQLFAGSIRENLLFVNPNATDEECLDVLHRSA
jgi:ATP-binding cassette subfamily B protein